MLEKIFKRKKEPEKWHNLLDTIDTNPEAGIFMIFGERANGKTYSALDYALKRWGQTGEQFAYIRRNDIDMKKKSGDELMSVFVKNGLFEKYCNGKYNSVTFRSGRWYPVKIEEKDGKRFRTIDETPIAYSFNLSTWKHEKGANYPDIMTILFDEFIDADGRYINDEKEYQIFEQLISTVLRNPNQKKARVIMVANTLEFYGCPYFTEWGLNHIDEMQPGDKQAYKFINPRTNGAKEVIVHYADAYGETEIKDRFFSNDDPDLVSCVNSSGWSLSAFPHYDGRIRPCDIVAKLYIKHEHKALCVEVVQIGNNAFLNIHNHKGKIDEDNEIIYCIENNFRCNWRTNIMKPTTRAERKILELFILGKVFYGTNTAGVLMRAYLRKCERL